MEATPDTLLFLVTYREYVAGAGLPPDHANENFVYYAAPVGKLMRATKITFNPKGELFAVRGADVFSGHLPLSPGEEWFTDDRKVGTAEWGNYKFLLFDPQGELYAVTNQGDLFKGPAPTDKALPWKYHTGILMGSGNWNSLRALFFDPKGILYAVRSDGKLIRRSPPTGLQDNWFATAQQVGKDNWYQLTHFIAFSPEGELWCASKIVSLEPQALATQKTFTNSSGQPHKYSFSVSKEITTTSTFSHDQSYTVSTKSEITFSAGIPSILETEGKISINTSTTRTWNFTETNTITTSFSATTDVTEDLLPGTHPTKVLIPWISNARAFLQFFGQVFQSFNGFSDFASGSCVIRDKGATGATSTFQHRTDPTPLCQ
uniref:Tachylectin 2 domain-containing protein n=1 Tax=Leptobrachium leishanense TaxID=445787 RepID=A0A8C5PJC0_9ANUR